MGDELVRAVGHRDGQAAAESRALTLEEGREHLGHRSERAGGEVGDLDRWPLRCRVLEDAGPAEVVEVVTGSVRMSAFRAEAGDRAVDGRLRCLSWPDS